MFHVKLWLGGGGGGGKREEGGGGRDRRCCGMGVGSTVGLYSRTFLCNFGSAFQFACPPLGKVAPGYMLVTAAHYYTTGQDLLPYSGKFSLVLIFV